MSDVTHQTGLSEEKIDSASNLQRIRDEISSALEAASRPASAVTITAISKKHDAARILPVLTSGHRIFGENRVQEAAQKWPALRAKFPDIELRLVGPLQSNKTKEAVALFDAIESIDRPKIAAAIAREMKSQNRKLQLFVQVNTGDEPQKSGVSPTDTSAFVTTCRNEHGLTIDGLMCIPPADQDPAPHFALLAKLAKENGLREVSMGMSGDYALAARLGATRVRVGSSIFGARPASV